MNGILRRATASEMSFRGFEAPEGFVSDRCGLDWRAFSTRSRRWSRSSWPIPASSICYAVA